MKRQTPLRPLLKLSEDYEFTEIILADEVVNAVKILKGEFVNVTYYYGHVKVIPEGEINRLAYQYTIWDSAGHTKGYITQSQEFTNFIGDVLVAIIADENDKGEYVSPRINDPEESSL